MDITAERLRQLFDYDPATGKLTHGRQRPARYRRGATAGRIDSYGYRNISVDGCTYKAHRLVWLLEHGEWPADQLDHVNGMRDDNRITNLRAAGYVENGQNRSTQSNNRSGFPGVSWCTARRKWRAQITIAGKRVALGRFDTVESARDAYLAAKAQLHEFQPVPRIMG